MALSLPRRLVVVTVSLCIFGLAAFVAFSYRSFFLPAVNPDPNHTHADFAVWIDGKQLDFSASEFISGSSTDKGSHPTEGSRQYLHLHDNNGNVVHRHKPGLTLGDFFASLDSMRSTEGRRFSIGFDHNNFQNTDTFTFCDCSTTDPRLECPCEPIDISLYVNGQQIGNGPNYIFSDTDQILLTTAMDPAAIQEQISQLSDDACLYSKTCPWRGEPPTENCIADPDIPCREG